MALFIKYEEISIRIDLVNTDAKLARYTKRKLFAACHVDLRKLNRFAQEAKMLRVGDKGDVMVLLLKCKKRQELEDASPNRDLH